MILSRHARRLGAALLVAACSKAAPPPAPPPPEVRVVTIGTEPIANVIELPGRMQAVRTSEVRARVDGIVQRRLYTEGTDVREGQPLFAIDPRELRAHPLRIGLSMKVEVDTAAKANPATAAALARLQSALPASAIDAQADTLVRRIIADNLRK